METYFNKFVCVLRDFVTELKAASPSQGIQKFLSKFDSLDMGNIVIRYLNTTRNVENKLKSRDETIFSTQFKPLPGIDISKHWGNLSDEVKEKMWNYLNLMFLLCELMATQSSGDEVSPEKTQELKQLSDSICGNDIEFNPYSGIGKSENFSTESMFSGPDKLPGQTGGMDSLQKAALSQLVDMDKLKEELKNLNEDKINEASGKIKEMFGGVVDDNTTNMITDMLSAVTKELQGTDMSDDPFDSLSSVIGKVSEQMKPKFESGEFDINGFAKSAAEIAKQQDPENGQLLSDMISSMTNTNEDGEVGEDYINNCNQLLSNMGMGGMDIRNMDPSSMIQMMAGGAPTTNKKKKKGKKKRNK